MSEVESKRFNIRVYGILVESQQVLLSDEKIAGEDHTKFPGGGLEFGEGTVECVVREFLEEMRIDIEVLEHFYTTDFFQRSLWRADEQVLSIYYVVRRLGGEVSPLIENAYDYPEDELEKLAFRWCPLSELKAQHVTLPIDKVVVDMITDRWG